MKGNWRSIDPSPEVVRPAAPGIHPAGGGGGVWEGTEGA